MFCSVQVRITLEELQEGVTLLKLVQKGVPKEDRYGNGEVVENTTHGWKQQIFHRIRAVFRIRIMNGATCRCEL